MSIEDSRLKSHEVSVTLITQTVNFSDCNPVYHIHYVVGKFQTFWRGVPIIKDPFAMTINQQLLWELKPRTVIDLGAYKGGSALCMLSILHPEAKKSSDVEFIEGDLFQVKKAFPGDFLKVIKNYSAIKLSSSNCVMIPGDQMNTDIFSGSRY